MAKSYFECTGKYTALALRARGLVGQRASGQAGQRASGSMVEPGNTKGGSITVLLTSCLTGLESAL